MSEFAFFRFMSNNMLTTEESQHKGGIVDLTEVLHARGLECDDRISKLSEEKLREILEEVRKLRRKLRRLTTADNKSSSIENEEGELERHEEVPYIR